MKRKKTVRNVTLGALATAGLVPLAGVGAEAAAAGESPAGLCSSTFGERGPGGGLVVGEGPPGDPMTVTVGWDPSDWPEGLREVVTCVSVDGHAVPALTRLTVQPPNAGNIAVDLRLPPGAPGALVCQQSILIGTRSTEGRQRQTSAVCFKLRAAEELLAGPETAAGQTPPSATSPPVRVTAPSPAPAPTAPAPAADMKNSTPPARAAFEAARGAARSPAAWSTAPARPAPAEAVTVAPAPTRVKPAPAPTRLNPAPAPTRVSPAPAPAAKAGRAANELARSASVAGRAAGSASVSQAGTPGAPGAEAARAALPRTGVGDRIPLAAAGGLMGLGGAGIILGEPRRRARRPA